MGILRLVKWSAVTDVTNGCNVFVYRVKIKVLPSFEVTETILPTIWLCMPEYLYFQQYCSENIKPRKTTLRLVLLLSLLKLTHFSHVESIYSVDISQCSLLSTKIITAFVHLAIISKFVFAKCCSAENRQKPLSDKFPRWIAPAGAWYLITTIQNLVLFSDRFYYCVGV